MFKLHAVQAEFGDALILEYGTKTQPRFTVIDGGPDGTYDDSLKSAIKKIVKNGKLDMVVVSHVDKDHIVGVVDLLAALEDDAASGRKPSVKIGGLWHNSFQRAIDHDGAITNRLMSVMAAAASTQSAMPLAADAFLGIKEGHQLRILAKKLKIKVNDGFTKDLIQQETATKPIKLGNVTLRVIGPNKANLAELRKEWLKWLDKTEKNMGHDPATLANADRSVPNLSSIVLLAERNGKSMLLTGDARGDHILDGLGNAGLLNGGKLHVDLLKVQHHGSNRNATATFFKKVTADTYLISANGENDNPDYDTLKWIVEAAKSASRKIQLIVTNETASTRKIKKTHKPADSGYTIKAMPSTAHSIEVALE